MRKNTFELYDSFINSLYPPAQYLEISRISDLLISRLELAVNSGQLERQKVCSIESRTKDHLVLSVDEIRPEKELQFNEDLVVLSLHRLSRSDDLLESLHEEIRQRFSYAVGSPFVFVNTRMWITKPNASRHGSNDFHRDGFAPGHLKCMIYLTPLDEGHGFFEFKTASGNQRLINFPKGTALIFRNSDIEHSGVPGTKYPRISIEVTLMRATHNVGQLWSGNFYGRHCTTPTLFSHISGREFFNHRKEPIIWDIPRLSGAIKVNIGSGKRDWKGWYLFDELDHPQVHKLTFNSEFTFPLEKGSASLFYSSHCFEHLDDVTLTKVLSEMYRTGVAGALFVLKIPDYDYLLSHLRFGVSSSLRGKGYDEIIETWKGRLKDNFPNRVATMFCSYWNSDYGDHFSAEKPKGEKPYIGPPVLSSEEINTILLNPSPRFIAKKLSEHARADPQFSRFNHQSAWSTSEMESFLSYHGFEVITNSKYYILQRFSGEIPDLDKMFEWSSYFLARKI